MHTQLTTFEILNEQIKNQILDCTEIQLEFSEKSQEKFKEDGTDHITLQKFSDGRILIRRFTFFKFLPENLHKELIKKIYDGDWLKPTIFVEDYDEFWDRFWINLDEIHENKKLIKAMKWE